MNAHLGVAGRPEHRARHVNLRLVFGVLRPKPPYVVKGNLLRRRNMLLGLTGALCASAAFVVERRTRPRVKLWPELLGPVHAMKPVFAADFGVRRVFVDPGHGAPNNAGNVSCECRDEQDFTLDVSRNVADVLRRTGHFDVKLSRDGDERVAYQARVDAATAWGADAFLSFHSDIRGQTGETQMVAPEKVCRVNLSAPGFSVLFSEDGDARLVADRRTLARAAARRMREAGFGAYAGTEYGSLYERDQDEAGVFMDRHAYEQRIFVLWRPPMPSVIVETHHALDPREVRLWAEMSTHEAFAAALAAALSDALGGAHEAP
jgi:N-acetylmuramoyl-L-alanine amidase